MLQGSFGKVLQEWEHALEGLEWLNAGLPAMFGSGPQKMEPEWREKVEAAIAELKSEQAWSMEAAAEELVDLWAYFPPQPERREAELRLALIEHVGNRMMMDCRSHEKVAEIYRRAFVARFGDHLCAERIKKVPGLSDEVRDVLVRVAQEGVAVPEIAPRWDLRLKMNADLAAEHGWQAFEKVIKDGRAGRIMLLSSLVEEALLKDETRVMVARFIRVAKRFL